MQWQCKNYRKYNEEGCENAIIRQEDMEKAFVKAFNSLYEKKDKYLAQWKATEEGGTELERIRAQQMAQLLGEPPLEKFVPEIAQLVIAEITVIDGRRLEFEFMDGSRVKTRI